MTILWHARQSWRIQETSVFQLKKHTKNTKYHPKVIWITAFLPKIIIFTFSYCCLCFRKSHKFGKLHKLESKKKTSLRSSESGWRFVLNSKWNFNELENIYGIDGIGTGLSRPGRFEAEIFSFARNFPNIRNPQSGILDKMDWKSEAC